MPLLRISQKHKTTWSQPPYNFYHFPEEHRAGWQQFWKANNGDLDKIVAFAEKSEIECPNEWAESLHLFLFSTFWGNSKLLKKVSSPKSGSKAKFGEFVKQIAENHTNDPKDRAWYTTRGVTHSSFLGMLERASEIKDIRQAVGYINARVKDLGFHIYSEYLLSQTKYKDEIRSVASEMNKQAYTLESEVLGDSPLKGISKGDTFIHGFYPNDNFMVIDVISKNGNIEALAARDQQGKMIFVQDLWNVQVY